LEILRGEHHEENFLDYHVPHGMNFLDLSTVAHFTLGVNRATVENRVHNRDATNKVPTVPSPLTSLNVEHISDTQESGIHVEQIAEAEQVLVERERVPDYLSRATGGNAIAIDSTIDPLQKTSQFYRLSKRLIDVVLALFGLVVLMPVILVIAVCIKLDDGGSILYFREMVGKHGQKFFMLKFRTMMHNADTYLEAHPELMREYKKSMKLKHDPRVTRVGRFLRKTYLDELPQLYNVLIGQMSLVGPRAIPQREQAFYGKYLQKRLSVKPGLTGLWQISPNRYRCYEDRIPLDMKYIDTRSLITDITIIVKTIWVCFVQTGV
jgi:exopolysaccharide production protein ExoY